MNERDIVYDEFGMRRSVLEQARLRKQLGFLNVSKPLDESLLKEEIGQNLFALRKELVEFSCFNNGNLDGLSSRNRLLYARLCGLAKSKKVTRDELLVKMKLDDKFKLGNKKDTAIRIRNQGRLQKAKKLKEIFIEHGSLFNLHSINKDFYNTLAWQANSDEFATLGQYINMLGGLVGVEFKFAEGKAEQRREKKERRENNLSKNLEKVDKRIIKELGIYYKNFSTYDNISINNPLLYARIQSRATITKNNIDSYLKIIGIDEYRGRNASKIPLQEYKNAVASEIKQHIETHGSLEKLTKINQGLYKKIGVLSKKVKLTNQKVVDMLGFKSYNLSTLGSYRRENDTSISASSKKLSIEKTPSNKNKAIKETKVFSQEEIINLNRGL